MIGSPPCTGSTGILSMTIRPPTMRSSQFLVERRDTAALRPFSTATWALKGVAPSILWSHNRCPPSSKIAIATFHLFLIASASHAAAIFLRSLSVRHGLVFTSYSLVLLSNSISRKRRTYLLERRRILYCSQ